MNEEERKERFIALLSELLGDYSGVKMKLAKKLNIKPPTLTRWFQGKVDPATLDLAVFVRVAEVANRPIDDLASFLGIVEDSEEKILDNFKSFIKDLLSTQSQDSLAKRLGISEGAVAGWVRSQRKVDPRRVAISTVAGLAKEKGWTIKRLLIYLGLKDVETENNLFFKLQSGATVLSLNEQVKLLAWLSDLVQEKVVQEKTIDKVTGTQSDRTLCIILEKEDLTIASKYLKNLYIYTDLKAENISIAAIALLPQSLEHFDTLIFDISSADSPSIPLIESFSFEGDKVVFVPESLPADVTTKLSNQSTDVVVKPIDWQELKNKDYLR